MSLIFWFINACLLLLAAAFILYPVLRRNKNGDDTDRDVLNLNIHREHFQDLENEFKSGRIGRDEYEVAKQDLERDMLADVSGQKEKIGKVSGNHIYVLVAAILILPAFSIVMYMSLGDMDILKQKTAGENRQTDSPDMHSIQEMVVRLEERLQQEPEDGEGWHMLGRSYVVMNRFSEAANAFTNARKYIGDEPGLLADLSEALILANNNMITSEALGLARLSLEKNPDEQKSLWITGYASYEQGNIPMAVNYWEHLLRMLPPDSNEAKSLSNNLASLKQQLAAVQPGSIQPDESGISGEPVSEKATSGGMQQASEIDVQVNVDPSLTGKIMPEDTVFIFARASSGPRMPLAIVRKKAGDLPVKVTLNDSLAMSENMTLSKFNEVVIGARISRSGNAMPQSGDLSGSSAIIQLDEVTGVKITINEVIP